MRTKLVQSKIEPELKDYIERLPDFKFFGMSNYVRKALIEASGFGKIIKKPKVKI